MGNLETLLQKVRSLNEEKKYKEVIDLLPEEILTQYNNANLYAEKAQAYYKLKDNKNCKSCAEHALKHDKNNAKAHNYLGNVCSDLEDNGGAILYYNKAIEIDPEYSNAYSNLGNIYFDLKDYDQAKRNYEKAIEIDSQNFYAYTGLGGVYKNLNNTNKAKHYYNKAIKINPEYIHSYNGLGAVYYDLNNFEQAKKYYEKAIRLDPNIGNPYYNLALLLDDSNEYKEAKDCYEQYLLLKTGKVDYYTERAKLRIEDINKLLAKADLKPLNTAINQTVNYILDLLMYKGDCVIHYTGLSVAKALVLEKSKFRLSEGTFLNDTSEGIELFEYVKFNLQSEKHKGTEAVPFTHKPFIGSFVAENKYDDLTLWRMYGKENKVEACGCAIVMQRETLIQNITDSVNKDGNMNTADKEFCFYRVAYKENIDGKNCKFVIPGGDKNSEDELNKLMAELAGNIEQFNEHKNTTSEDKQTIAELLNSIAYLFKSAEYQYEHELRLVVKGVGFEKHINTGSLPPRVYIELVEILPLIKKLTIGPKVERADEWAAAFHYSLAKEGHEPQILISHLPYK